MLNFPSLRITDMPPNRCLLLIRGRRQFILPRLLLCLTPGAGISRRAEVGDGLSLEGKGEREEEEEEEPLSSRSSPPSPIREGQGARRSYQKPLPNRERKRA